MSYQDQIELLAAACHSAWYSYAVLGLGEDGDPWNSAEQHQRESMIKGVEFWERRIDKEEILNLNLSTLADMYSEVSHDEWVRHKEENGWRYGPNKHPELKEHPCMVPYEDLPEEQRAKDKAVLVAYLSLKKIILEHDLELLTLNER